MFCKYCASQIADDAAFCSKCGKAANEDMAAAQKRQERRKRVAILSAYAAFTIAIGILSCLCLRNARAADSAARRAEEAYQMAYDTPIKLSNVLAKIIYDNGLRNGIASVQIGDDIIAIEPYRPVKGGFGAQGVAQSILIDNIGIPIQKEFAYAWTFNNGCWPKQQ